MRSINRYSALTILFFFLLALPNSAFAFTKYKVALLPIINTANVKDAEVLDLLQYKIHRKLRFPFYEFIPDTEVTSGVKLLTMKKGHLVPDQHNLSFAAQSLSADIVVAVEVVRGQAELRNSFSFSRDDEGETIEDIDVLLKTYVYSAKDNQYYIIKAAKFDSAPLSINSGLLHAAGDVMDELLKKFPFETIPKSI